MVSTALNANAGTDKDNRPVWPFPTKDNPLKPWTPKEVKSCAKLQREKAQRSAQESPL